MADTSKMPIMSNYIAYYIKVKDNYEVMTTFTGIDENPQAQTVERHYQSNRSATIITTGYKTQFPITGDMYRNNAVMEFLRDVGELQQLDVTTELVIVRLYQPIENKEDTYFARHTTVGVEISNLKVQGGQIIELSGNLNSQTDMEIGTFNIVTKEFAKEGEVTFSGEYKL